MLRPFLLATLYNHRILMDRLEDRLRADLERLAQRTYSEAGIPMFLVCENLPAAQKGAAERTPRGALNEQLATAFRRDAEAWARARADAAAADAARIVERIAASDFGPEAGELFGHEAGNLQ
jgi:hypothetical protein